jgi:signal peptidase II
MNKKDLWWVLGSLFGVIAVDQLSKYFVLQASPQYHWEYFHIILHFNKGAMLGLFSDLPPVLRIVSLSTGGAFLLFSFVIFQYLLPTRSMRLRLGMSILIGGILGNVIDRTLWGHVVDFLIIGNRSLSTGVFNLADMLQWFGYYLMGHALLKDQDNLWPKDNLRKVAWIHPKFQLRYCYILVTCGLGFSLIAGVFSYTFLRYVVIDLMGNNSQILDQFLIPFLVTFCSVSLAFTAFLFMVGKQLSHRIVGPVYAFERFIDSYIDGHYYQLRLRKGDEFPELEELAEKIANELRPVDDVSVVPILPEGQIQTDSPSHQELTS